MSNYYEKILELVDKSICQSIKLQEWNHQEQLKDGNIMPMQSPYSFFVPKIQTILLKGMMFHFAWNGLNALNWIASVKDKRYIDVISIIEMKSAIEIFANIIFYKTNKKEWEKYAEVKAKNYIATTEKLITGKTKIAPAKTDTYSGIVEKYANKYFDFHTMLNKIQHNTFFPSVVARILSEEIIERGTELQNEIFNETLPQKGDPEKMELYKYCFKNRSTQDEKLSELIKQKFD